MKSWNIPVIMELNIEKTANTKPACYVDKNGTCQYWCNGNNPAWGACPYHGGACKLGTNSSNGSGDPTGMTS